MGLGSQQTTVTEQRSHSPGPGPAQENSLSTVDLCIYSGSPGHTRPRCWCLWETGSAHRTASAVVLPRWPTYPSSCSLPSLSCVSAQCHQHQCHGAFLLTLPGFSHKGPGHSHTLQVFAQASPDNFSCFIKGCLSQRVSVWSCCWLFPAMLSSL
jgi:hypothetical protein